MSTSKATGQALERVARPQEQALIQVASDLGIVRYAEGGGMLIDLSGDALKDKYNVLAPAATIAKGDANFTPAISVIKLEQSDFYEIEKGKAASGGYAAKPAAYALTKRALDVIGKQAGIEDLSPEIVYFGANDANVRVTWHSRVRRPDGTFQTLSGTREWIEEDEMAQLKGAVPEWAQKGESAYNKWWNDNWYGRVKKFRIPMTETKARLRAYRQALTLKSKYTLEEIQKPFLVSSTSFTPDTSDPEILRMVFTGGERAAGLLYGPGPKLVGPADEDHTIEGACYEEEERPALTAPAGVDPETGEIAATTHGPRPTDDPVLPGGQYTGKPLSEVALSDPGYVRAKLLNSTSPKWGIGATDWLAYWGHAKEEDSDVEF